MMTSMKPLAKFYSSDESGRPVPVSSRVGLRAGQPETPPEIVIARGAMIDGRWCRDPPGWSRPVIPSDDLRAHLGAALGSLHGRIVPEAALGSGGRSRIEALALLGAGSRPRWELDLRRSPRLRHTSSPPPIPSGETWRLRWWGALRFHAAGARVPLDTPASSTSYPLLLGIRGVLFTNI